MKGLLSQGLSYSVLSFAICGCLSDSRRVCQKFARNRPQGHSQKFREPRVQGDRGTNGVKSADCGQSGGRVESAVDIDRLSGEVAIASEHHRNSGNLLRAADRGNQFTGGRFIFFVVHGNVGAGLCKRDRNHPSDATTAARDESNLSADIHGSIKRPRPVFVPTQSAIRICTRIVRLRPESSSRRRVRASITGR